MVGVRPAYVWDVSQTTGDPIPAPPSPRLLEGEAPDGLWEGIARLVEAEGFTVWRVPHEDMIHGANGLTDFGVKTVAVRENMPGQVHQGAHHRFRVPGRHGLSRYPGDRRVTLRGATGDSPGIASPATLPQRRRNPR